MSAGCPVKKTRMQSWETCGHKLNKCFGKLYGVFAANDLVLLDPSKT